MVALSLTLLLLGNHDFDFGMSPFSWVLLLRG
jgi:2',3'-cyclic-nucleotide 2'-phosphodiesterase (5'-nucleotidase family)